MLILKEYERILNEQSPIELRNKWLINPHQLVFMSNLELPIAIDLQEMRNKTDDEIKTLIQHRIIHVLDIKIDKIESFSNQTNNSSDQGTPHH